MELLLALELLIIPSLAFVPSDFTSARVPGKCGNSTLYDCGEKCISFDKLRNCQYDCLDGSDESNYFQDWIDDYWSIKKNFCPSSYVLCDNSQGGCGQCLSPSVASSTCLDRKYARLCVLKETLKCRKTSNCVYNDWILDGNNDCFDGSDEDPCYVNRSGCDPNAICSFNGTTVSCMCQSGYFGNGKFCSSNVQLLSYANNVPGGRIPGNCSSTPLQFDCGPYCISIYQFRDCVNDCPNGEDEVPCGRCRCVAQDDFNLLCQSQNG